MKYYLLKALRKMWPLHVLNVMSITLGILAGQYWRAAFTMLTWAGVIASGAYLYYRIDKCREIERLWRQGIEKMLNDFRQQMKKEN